MVSQRGPKKLAHTSDRYALETKPWTTASGFPRRLASSGSVWWFRRSALAPPSTQPKRKPEKTMLCSRVVCFLSEGSSAPSGTNGVARVTTGAPAGNSPVMALDGAAAGFASRLTPVPNPTVPTDRSRISGRLALSNTSPSRTR